MKAVGYEVPGPIEAEASLVDIDLPEPSPTGHDLLVEVKAISVKPNLSNAAIKPVVGAVLPLARIGEAHEMLENGRSRGLRGKVVADMSAEAAALPAARPRTKRRER